MGTHIYVPEDASQEMKERIEGSLNFDHLGKLVSEIFGDEVEVICFDDDPSICSAPLMRIEYRNGSSREFKLPRQKSVDEGWIVERVGRGFASSISGKVLKGLIDKALSAGKFKDVRSFIYATTYGIGINASIFESAALEAGEAILSLLKDAGVDARLQWSEGRMVLRVIIPQSMETLSVLRALA